MGTKSCWVSACRPAPAAGAGDNADARLQRFWAPVQLSPSSFSDFFVHNLRANRHGKGRAQNGPRQYCLQAAGLVSAGFADTPNTCLGRVPVGISQAYMGPDGRKMHFDSPGYIFSPMWERLCAPRATELPRGRFGVPLPSPHAPLYLEKDDLRARIACAAFPEVPRSCCCAAQMANLTGKGSTQRFWCALGLFLLSANNVFLAVDRVGCGRSIWKALEKGCSDMYRSWGGAGGVGGRQKKLFSCQHGPVGDFGPIFPGIWGGLHDG